MAETNESTVTEGTNQDAPSTPEPADQTDWKAQARKWEALAKQNKDAAARLAEIEEASKSDTEKQTARADQAEARANQLVARVLAAEIAKAAIEAKAIDGDAVAALIASKVTLGDDGEITGLTDALSDLQRTKPALFVGGPGAPYVRDAAAVRTPAHKQSAADEFAAATAGF